MATGLSGVFPGRERRGVQAVSRPATGTVGYHVLGEALFIDALVRERKRADRSDTAFAVLLVDRNGNGAEPVRWGTVLRAAALAKRDIDVMGWVERGQVFGLLMPEEPGKRALQVVDRVRREIARRIGDEAAARLSLRLYTHGERAAADADGCASVDLLLEAFVRRPSHPWRDAAKRGLDIVGSATLLVLFAPVLVGALIAVKWTSPGPALFRQVRVGRRGEGFTMLKFRTMYVNSGHGIHQDYVKWFIKSSGQQSRTGNEVFKLTNDPRITRVGRILRKTSLDELPQFWNVLRGDMSLVGPRPPLPFEVEQYQPWHRRRVLEAKPGVTGPWQVHGRSRTTFDEMVRLDLRYARTHSLWMDIRILAATPRAMVSGKGAC